MAHALRGAGIVMGGGWIRPPEWLRLGLGGRCAPEGHLPGVPGVSITLQPCEVLGCGGETEKGLDCAQQTRRTRARDKRFSTCIVYGEQFKGM